jgi:hypothetical protein
MNLIFRVDDIYLNNTRFENDLLAIFHKHKIKLVLGIIPFDTNDKPFAEKLGSSISNLICTDNFEIALHGYKHVKTDLWGEFYGVEKKKQELMLASGKDHLEELTNKKIKTFIPPWNALDSNTCIILKSLNFEIVSNGHDERTKNLSIENILTVIPYSVEHLFFLKSRTFKIIETLSRIGLFKRLTIVVLYHPYNFIDWLGKPYFSNSKSKFNMDLSELEMLLGKLSKSKNINSINFNELNAVRPYKNLFLSFLYKLETRRILYLHQTIS